MHRENYLRECLEFFPDHLSLSEPKNSSTTKNDCLEFSESLVTAVIYHSYRPVCREYITVHKLLYALDVQREFISLHTNLADKFENVADSENGNKE